MIALTVVASSRHRHHVGMVSGYFGGRFDVWMQRFVELVSPSRNCPLWR